MTIRKDGPVERPYCLYSDSTGERIACHETEEQAQKQETAIKESKQDSDDFVTRFDKGRTNRIDRTPQGGVRVDAVLTRTGVFPYKNADGTIRKEYRPPDEVLKKDTLESLAGAPVTRDHAGMVDASNWRQLTRGHVLGSPRADDSEKVAATLDVQDAELAQEVLSKKVKEVSCGYRCRLDWTPGEAPDGQRYDAIQRDITNNHVALGPPGWGRQGKDVSLRLDSGSAVMQDSNTESTGDLPMQVTVDGIEYEAGSKSHLDAVEKQIQRLEKEKQDAVSRADSAEGERDELKKERDSLKERTDKIDSEIDDLVSQRLQLREDARKVLGNETELPSTPREVMETVVKKDANSELDLSQKSDDYVRARFDAAVERVNEQPKTNEFRKVTDREDKSEDKSEENRSDAREKFMEKSQQAWRQPLAVSADK